MRPVPAQRHVLILAVDRAQSLDILGPVEVFHTATTLAPEAGYRVELVTPGQAGEVALSNGLALSAGPLPDPPPRHDTLVVAGGVGTREAVGDARLVAWVAAAAARARRTTSVCTGAYLLAEAGLLAGRSATTHWRWCEPLARRYPDVALDGDAIYVHDGDVWTSAGVTAGIDLALALVEEDVGRDVALAVAQELVVFLRRPGGQSQFSRAPAAYVEALRIERARMLLEDGAESLEAVARATGFASPEVLRRAFHRRVGVSPAAYRDRFRLAA